MADDNLNSRLSISPNPAHDKLTVTLDEQLKGNGMIGIYNSSGEMVFYQELNSSSQMIDINLAAGVYVINVDNGEKIFTRKIVIQ
jgi:hypothetical protein